MQKAYLACQSDCDVAPFSSSTEDTRGSSNVVGGTATPRAQVSIAQVQTYVSDCVG